jgi:hypothetical protein
MMLASEGDRDAMSTALPPPVAPLGLVDPPAAVIAATELEATASAGSLGVVRRNLTWLLLSQMVTWSASIVLLIAAPATAR